MDQLNLGWIAWFFHGSAPVWIAVLVCAAVMYLCYRMDWVRVLIGVAALAIFFMILGTAGGLYNVSRMERCFVCAKILPPEYAYTVCPEHIELSHFPADPQKPTTLSPHFPHEGDPLYGKE